MFEKLLAVLPYNPALGQQLGFYARRMREEATIRRTGLIFLVLTFMVQFFAVLSPPQATVAASNNDLINGGLSSVADAKSNCKNDVQNFKSILANYGISCDDVGNGSDITIHSAADNDNYYSMGRLPYGARNPNTNKVTDEQPVSIPGAGTLYIRKLNSFDTYGGNGEPYAAIRVTSGVTKEVYYLLKACGNLVHNGVPRPVPQVVKQTPQPTTSTPAPVTVTPNVTVTPAAPAPAPAPTPVTPATPACQYNSSLPANSPSCFQPCQYNSSIPASSAQCYQPCQYNNLIAANDVNCKPCDKSLSSQDTLACISVSKAASNVTAGITDANNTTANPGDTIVYTLYAQNTGKAAVKAFTFQENLSDVLDYADVVDLHGGSMDGGDQITWPAIQIDAGRTASQQITIRVKNPVPQTPASTSDPGHFDLIMTNVYGNTINIKVPGSVTKTIETATTTTLPNTGPGSSLFIAAVIVMTAGYFYGRARLLARESELALKENAQA